MTDPGLLAARLRAKRIPGTFGDSEHVSDPLCIEAAALIEALSEKLREAEEALSTKRRRSITPATEFVRAIPSGRYFTTLDIPDVPMKDAFNAIHYAIRCGEVERVSRGRYLKKDSK